MLYFSITLIIASLIIFSLGVALGKSLFVIKLRREENRRRELELAVLEKRSQILKESKDISNNLEELLFKANVQQEINNILRNKENI
jgi:hypothetical protein